MAIMQPASMAIIRPARQQWLTSDRPMQLQITTEIDDAIPVLEYSKKSIREDHRSGDGKQMRRHRSISRSISCAE
jgi:hypothetical protein